MTTLALIGISLPADVHGKLRSLSGAGQVCDDYICEDYPHTNHGVTATLEFGVKHTGGQLAARRTLLRPETSGWRNHPELIDSVRLVIYAAAGVGHTGAYFYVNRLLVDAAYGDSSSQYCPTYGPGAVFTAYYCLCESIAGQECSMDSIPWNQPGCSGVGSDFYAAVSDSFALGRDAFDSAYICLTEDFKWFCEHPDSNFGWVIWRDDQTPTGNYRSILSTQSNYAGGAYRPRLEIFYSPKRAALVLNDTSSAAAIGVDSLLYQVMLDDLDYEVNYLTDEDVVRLGSAYFDTAFDVVVWAGEEVAGPSPSSNADTIQESSVGWVSLYRWNYDENHLGIGEAVLQDARCLAVNRDHWITRVLQDTLFMFMDESITSANYRFAPDSARAIVPLLVDEDHAADTAYVNMCAAAAGDSVYDGIVAPGRRVFLGLFHADVDQRDSCQFYTIFNRAVAWAANDTGNFHVSHNACFSGWLEVEDSWAENSSGSDSLQSFGAGSALYTGFDFNEKVAFMKISNDALSRKLNCDSVTVASFKIRTKVKQVANNLEDSLWQQTNGIRLIRLLWKCGRELGSDSSDFVSWTYRYLNGPDSMAWSVGGAHALGIDVVDTVMDSLRQNRDNTAPDSICIWEAPPWFAVRMLADTSQNHGWVWHNLYHNQDGQINDAEILYYSSDVGDPRDKPLISVCLEECVLTQSSPSAKRRWEIIGNGLLENVR